MTNKTLSALIIISLLCTASANAEEKITHFGINGLKPEPRSQDSIVSKAELKALLFALTDSDFNKRIDAQWKLRIAGDKSIMPELIELLNDKRPYVKQLSCELLGELGDKSALPHIAKLLEDKEDQVKETAARTLAACGDRTVVADLIKAINKPRNLTDTAFYWMLTDDVFENYRYAAVEAVNKITNNHFYFKRNETNFARIAAQNLLNKWWRGNELFFTGEIDKFSKAAKTLTEEARELKTIVSSKDCTQITGGEDLARNIDALSDKTKAFDVLISSLPSNKQKVFPEFNALIELANYIDEIFVYSEQVAELKPEWKKIKSTLKEIESYINKFGLK